MAQRAPIHIWRKLATRAWLEANEAALQAITNGAFAAIERPTRKRLLVEVAGRSADALTQRFGGRSEKLSRDWLNELLRKKSTEPIRIGNRLTIRSDGRASVNTVIIPAGAAFGTGEHATTAMSLRLLERVTRGLTSGWRMLDAGTGSGILALAARRFGAGEVIAVENNPLALATAKQNARLNRIRGVKFVEGDVAQEISGRFDIITANLYSDLLIELLPRFRRALARDGKLILSGVMRAQEGELLAGIRRNGFDVLEIRRRGKWLALLVSFPGSTSPTGPTRRTSKSRRKSKRKRG